MNSDQHDPKYQASPVNPGDDWGDLDRESKMPQMGLPPRRLDRGIPIKRELNSVTAKRHAPYPKLCDDDPPPSIEPLATGAEAPSKPATKAAKKAARKVAKKQPKSATKRSAKKQDSDPSGKIMDDTPQGVFEITASADNHVSSVEPEAEEREILLPVTSSPGSKRFRVNEIAPQRPVAKRTQNTPLAISKTRGKWTSNESLMQNGGIQSAEAISSDVRNSRVTLIWIVCGGALVIAIVLGAILLSGPSKDGSGLEKLSVYSDPNPEESQEGSEFNSGKSLDALINGEDQAKKIFARYATSKVVEDFIDMVYLPDRNRDLILKIWEPMGVGPGWKPGDNCTWTVKENGGVQYGILSGTLANFSGFTAIFRQEGDGMKMDWKATTGHSSADYSLLKKGEGDGAEIRAILSPGDFHTFTLPEGEFRCYRLTAPDREENIWAYAKLGGAIDEKLSSQFIPSQLTGEAIAEVPVVLVLVRGPAQSLPNQWVISKVTSLNWLDE